MARCASAGNLRCAGLEESFSLSTPSLGTKLAPLSLCLCGTYRHLARMPPDPRRGHMCRGDDTSCPDYEKHLQEFKGELDAERRSFLKSSFAATGGVAAFAAGGMSLVTPALAQASMERQPAKRSHMHLPATADTVHWGYFSKTLKPQVEVDSGRLRHHRDADPPRGRRPRAHGQGRSGRRERLSVDQGQERREPARRRPDRCLDSRARRRRRLRRAYHDRACGGARRRAGRYSGGAYHRRRAAPQRQPRLQGQELRLERRRLVGLPLQGPADGAQAARGDHHL